MQNIPELGSPGFSNEILLVIHVYNSEAPYAYGCELLDYTPEIVANSHCYKNESELPDFIGKLPDGQIEPKVNHLYNSVEIKITILDEETTGIIISDELDWTETKLTELKNSMNTMFIKTLTDEVNFPGNTV